MQIFNNNVRAFIDLGLPNKELDLLQNEIINIFKKFGLSGNHALISANALINAELVGAYGHGLSRLKMYCDRINKKVINPRPKIKINIPALLRFRFLGKKLIKQF